MNTLTGKTIVITGASRGIGRSIALRLAREGAQIVIAAKSIKPHPKLKGTIHEVAREVEDAGGKALAMKVDVRFEDQVKAMVQAAADTFGGIDTLINNAGAISLSNVAQTSVKRFDLMQAVNARAVFVGAQAALPFLKKATAPHIISLSPPLNINERWLKDHGPYTLSKYGMTLLTFAMAAEFKPYHIAVNSLWPRTIIATAAIEFAVGNKDMLKHCRRPEIMADAVHAILTAPHLSLTGRTLIDEEVLREQGINDFSAYAYDAKRAKQIMTDLFMDD